MFVDRFISDIAGASTLSIKKKQYHPMALFRIPNPPGTRSAPPPIAVGIDPGTTHWLVAAVHHSVAECLPNNEGRVILPSAVRYSKAAAARSATTRWRRRAMTQNTIVSAKRFMGRALADVAATSAFRTISSTSRAWWACARVTA